MRDLEMDRMECDTCGKDCSRHYHMCDEQEGEWCSTCFPKTGCRKRHGEGCETQVFDDKRPNAKAQRPSCREGDSDGTD